MKAFLKNYRQAPRKVRVIANHVRGKNVAEALAVLEFMPNKGAEMLRKLVSSAVANAKQTDASVTPEQLVIKTVTANKGITFVRYMPRAFGRAYPINRECSHVLVELTRKGAPAPVSAAEKGTPKDEAPAKKSTKKTVKKAPKKLSTKKK